MFKILIADDDYEDRELLKLEIQRALGDEESDLRFYEAVSIAQAKELLKSQLFDLLTLDIEFDRMDEGIDALPELFENYPVLNIVVVSGKLDKSEVTERLFRFTRDNVLKGKRWARHFDVIDKKDDKTDALRRVYAFAFRKRDVADKLQDLFSLAESYLEKDQIDRCLDIYQKIQSLAPGEPESNENILIVKGALSPDHLREYYRKGEKVIASLLLGYHIETRLKAFTRRKLGQHPHGLSDCLNSLEQSHRISSVKKELFQQILRLRNRAVHHPTTISEKDFDSAMKNLKLLEAKI